MEYADAIKKRRSHYALGKDAPADEAFVRARVEECLEAAPSAFNMQAERVVLLFGAEHEKLWDLTTETLRAIVPPENFGRTEEKIRTSFRAGMGSLLYFFDETVVASYQQKFANYRDVFPTWSQQSNGMLQHMIWTSLCAAGFGASIQHYNPLIDDAVRKAWQLPESWTLVAQMPFGASLQAPFEKKSQALEERIRIFR